MSEKPDRVAVLGLDGADWRILQPLIEEGRMPELDSIMQRGAWTTMHSIEPTNSAAAWTSMLTGAPPGTHGIFGFTSLQRGSYRTRVFRTGDVKVPHVWEALKQFDRHCLIINLPSHYPAVDVNGAMVTGFLTPSEDSQWAYPAEIEQELTGQNLRFRKPVGVSELRQAEPQDALNMLNAQCERQVGTIMHLLETMPCDLLFSVFHSCDAVQHALLGPAWFEASSDMTDRPTIADALDTCRGSVIADHYERLDAAIGEIIDALPQNTSVLIVSDHGCVPTDRAFNADRWLQNHGYLRRTRLPSIGPDPRNWRHRTVRELVQKLKMGFLVPMLSETTLQKLIRVPRIGRMLHGAIDWRNTGAFVAPGQSGVGIRLNVKGREARGIVSGRDEYESVREEIIERLRQTQDPKTSQPICSKVWKYEHADSCDDDGYRPDILFRVEDRHTTIPAPSVEWVGDAKRHQAAAHHRDGIAVAAGPAINPIGKFAPVDITDVAPTILALHGIQPLSSMEGTVFECVTGGDAARSADTEEPVEPQPDDALTEDEQQTIVDRLSDLGYV